MNLVSKSPRTRLLRVGGGLLLSGALVTLAGCFGEGEPIVQPMDFSHATHVTAEEMRCKDCHDGESSVQAGMPPIKSCVDCHKKPAGDHPDEPKVREYRKAKTEIPWVQVNRNAGHVYFSHRVHVALAGLDCKDCHGDVAAWTVPPSHPQEDLHSMDACIDCHESEGASLDCAACHK
jgi:c(7)-type cytochrome triheme protein